MTKTGVLVHNCRLFKRRFGIRQLFVIKGNDRPLVTVLPSGYFPLEQKIKATFLKIKFRTLPGPTSS